MCGEKYSIRAISRQGSGSSPRVWGKGEPQVFERRDLRIIPTCVGKSFRNAQNVPDTADHPHVCGEKHASRHKKLVERGSSPRVWGKEPVGDRAHDRKRIIPTCVGKSSVPPRCLVRSPDHPHVCGEKEYRSRSASGICGSSPRVWGKGDWRRFKWTDERIIPTCVGKRVN